MSWLREQFFGEHPAAALLRKLKVPYSYDRGGSLVIEGNLDLAGKCPDKLPDLSYCTVMGEFDCSNNALTSLKGSPLRVGGNFVCRGNALKTLEGVTAEIGGDLHAGGNLLYTLFWLPVDFHELRTDLGDFRSLQDIPAQLLKEEGILENLSPAQKSVTVLRRIDGVKPVIFAKPKPQKTKKIIFKPKRPSGSKAPRP